MRVLAPLLSAVVPAVQLHEHLQNKPKFYLDNSIVRVVQLVQNTK